MALTPQKFREILLQLLFGELFSSWDEEEWVDLATREHLIPRKEAKAIWTRGAAILALAQELDQQVVQYCSSYDYDRIPNLEKAVLRLSIYELLHDQEIPPKVAIAEGMRLAKKYANPSALSFVNAVLDAIYQAPIPASLL